MAALRQLYHNVDGKHFARHFLNPNQENSLKRILNLFFFETEKEYSGKLNETQQKATQMNMNRGSISGACIIKLIAAVIYGGAPEWFDTRIGSGLTHKHWTRLERFARDKRSILLRKP